MTTILMVACAAALLTATTVRAAGPKLNPLNEDQIKKIAAAMPDKATVKPEKPRKLLIYWGCGGFFHGGGIAAGNVAIKMLGEKTGAFEATQTTDDSACFTPENLKQFDAIYFNNTCRSKVNEQQRAAILDFVKSGKGIVGNHAAADNFHDWPEGAAIIGATFMSHPWGMCPVKIDDPSHPLVKSLGGKGYWMRDEIYAFKEPYSREKLRVLLSMDAEKGDPKKAGRKDGDNAVMWIQQVGQGRMFYYSAGHEFAPFADPLVLRLFLDGIQYAMGDLKADATPSAKLNPQPTPILPPEKPAK
jgi:type 1 glutamine amidotransferase